MERAAVITIAAAIFAYYNWPTSKVNRTDDIIEEQARSTMAFTLGSTKGVKDYVDKFGLPDLPSYS